MYESTVTLRIRQVPYPPRPDEFPVFTSEIVSEWIGDSIIAHLGFDWWTPYARVIIRSAEVRDGDVTLTCAIYGHSSDYDAERFDGSDVGVVVEGVGEHWMLRDLAPVWSLRG